MTGFIEIIGVTCHSTEQLIYQPTSIPQPEIPLLNAAKIAELVDCILVWVKYL
jgi:hypothetical protein